MARPPGRKPAPTFLKLVKNGKKNRINRAEAVLPRGLPMPPEHLDDLAKVEWGRIAHDLYDAGVLTKADRAILALYCQSYSRWVEAEEALRAYRKEVMNEQHAKSGKVDPANGLTVTTSNGNVINNPLVGIANKAGADLARYATDLGLTPSARSRVTAKPPGKDDDPADKYFG